MPLIRSMLLDEIVKAINAHDYDFHAQLMRDGRISVEYSEREGKGIFNTKSFNLMLKVDE